MTTRAGSGESNVSMGWLNVQSLSSKGRFTGNADIQINSK